MSVSIVIQMIGDRRLLIVLEAFKIQDRGLHMRRIRRFLRKALYHGW